MIYAALNPEKFESDKGAKLMQVNFGSIFYRSISGHFFYCDMSHV